MCGNQGDGKRNISISGPGILIHAAGVLFGTCTQIVLYWIKPKTGALENTIIKEKRAQRNEAFNFQEANQMRKPPQYITNPGWPISPQGQSHSK